MQEERTQRLLAEELRFQLLLEHRRKQRKHKLDQLELLKILPADQIEKYLDRQRHFSATLIQACYRGYRERIKLAKHRESIMRERAAVCIQRAARRWLERLNRRRRQALFYSKPAGLGAERREILLDKIRKHLDSLPVLHFYFYFFFIL
jgi:hypothetical protein